MVSQIASFNQLIIQLFGVLVIGGFTVMLSGFFWLVLKLLVGIRVSAQQEMLGLDLSEHGSRAYWGFGEYKSPQNES